MRPYRYCKPKARRSGTIADDLLLVQRSIEQAKREILADIASGRVPADVVTFASLHDYVDANEYGGGCDWFYDHFREDDANDGDRLWYHANLVMDAVDSWLRAGRPD